MGNVNLKLYQNKTCVREVLGCLIQDPSLLSKYKISKNDFVEAFHKVIFVAINNQYEFGAKKLNSMIISNYLKEAFPSKYGIYKRNNGDAYVDKIKEFSSLQNFEYNYNELRKYSVLRSLVNKGFDVTPFFDPEEADPDIIDKHRELFESTSLDGLINYYKKLLIEINGDYYEKEGHESEKAGSERAKLQKEKWKKQKDFGLSYSSNLFTTVSNGIRKKRFVVGSAGTGTGKSRMSVANICHSFTSKYYDSKKQEWMVNPNGTQNKCLYIGTEMELIEEIEPILWAYIADVPQDHIMFNKYEMDEEQRVDEAIRILNEECNIYLEYVPDYDINTLEKIIEYHVNQNGVNHVFFDYIHITTDLISEFQNAAKARMQIREDQVLGNLSIKLKELCRKYNISIDTWTQVTGDFKNEQNRDQTIVRGAKAIIDKCDVAFIASRPTKKEFKLLEKVLKKQVGKPQPNLCYSVYKNRGGKYNQVKIWLYVDYDTMRVHDLFVTDYDYELLPVRPTYVFVDENQNISIKNDKENEIRLSMKQEKENELKRLKEKKTHHFDTVEEDIDGDYKIPNTCEEEDASGIFED